MRGAAVRDLAQRDRPRNGGSSSRAPRSSTSTPHRTSSPSEIEELMAVAARLPSRTGVRALTHQTLIGLLAASGLRSGEAVALDAGDVDLRHPERPRDEVRQVPLRAARRVGTGCPRSIRQTSRRALPDRRTSASLSRSGRQGRIERRAAHLRRSVTVHRSACTDEGPAHGRGPRLHDLRHTFATCRLVEWYRAGLDVDRLMPASRRTSATGGCRTHWYIQAVPELLALATEHQAAQKRVAP